MFKGGKKKMKEIQENEEIVSLLGVTETENN
jgi:hypothetical protein